MRVSNDARISLDDTSGGQAEFDVALANSKAALTAAAPPPDVTYKDLPVRKAAANEAPPPPESIKFVNLPKDVLSELGVRGNAIAYMTNDGTEIVVATPEDSPELYNTLSQYEEVIISVVAGTLEYNLMSDVLDDIHADQQEAERQYLQRPTTQAYAPVNVEY